MKVKILSVNKIYFIVIALAQAILGIIWVVLKAGKGHISPVSFLVGIVIIAGVSMLFILRKGKVLWITLALLSGISKRTVTRKSFPSRRSCSYTP